MALSLGESGGGYPRSTLRVTDSFDRSGLDTQPARGGGWFSSLLDASRQISEARRQREEAEKEEERRRAAQQAEYETIQRDEQKNLRDERSRVVEERLADPLKAWAYSASGHQFLSARGTRRVAYDAFEADPGKFLVESDSFREFNWGADPENRNALLQQGVPSVVFEAMDQAKSVERGAARQRFVDENADQDIGSFSDAGAGQLALARGATDEMRSRGTLGAFAGADPAAVNTLGQGYKQAYQADLGNFFDQKMAEPWEHERAARAFVQSALTAEKDPPWLESYRADFKRNHGRGLDWKDWEQYASEDPIGFLAAADPVGTRIEVAAHFGAADMRDDIRLPEFLRQAVAERRTQQPEIIGAYAKNQTTPGQEFFRTGRGSVLGKEFNLGIPGDSAPEKIAGMLAGGMSRQIETQSSAIAQFVRDTRLGDHRAPWASPEAAENIDQNVATHFGDMDTRQKWGVALDAAITDIALITPMKFGGATALRGLGIASTPARETAMSYAIGTGVALGYDVPGTIAALKLQGYGDDEIKRMLPLVVGADLFPAVGRAASPVVKPALGKTLAGIPAEIKSGAVAYFIARSLGADDDESRYYALAAVAATSFSRRGVGESFKTGFGAADVLNKAQRAPAQEAVIDLPAGPDIMYHGTAGEFSGQLRPDAFLTPNLADAEAFARGSSRLTGEPATVIAFQAKDGATIPSRSDDFAASQGARQVVDPDGLVEVGRSGVEMRPAMGAGIEPADIPPKPGPSPKLVNKGDDVVPDDYAPPELAPNPTKTNIVQPKPADGIPIAKPDMGEDFLRKADEQLDSHRATDAYKAVVARVRGEGNDGTLRGSARDKLASLLNVPTHLIEAIDPASKYARPVLRSVLAASNFLNSQAIELVGRQRQIVSDLKPLIGEEFSRRLEREAVRLSPAAAGVAASVPFGGPETETGRKLIAAGAVASYGMHMGDAGIKRKLPFDSIKYTSKLDGGNLPGAKVNARDLPAGLKTGQGKLVHMILHPEDFDLTPDQLKAAKASQGTLQAAFAGMQEFQDWAGKQVTKDTIGQENRLFQWFTKESVEKVLGKDYFAARSGKPGFAADLPVEQQRRLGDNIVDAMIKHPELKIDGDVVGLMMRDLDQKTRVSSNAIIVKGLTSGTEGVDGFVKDRTAALGDKLREAITLRDSLGKDDPRFVEADSAVGNLMKELKTAEAAEAALGVDRTWGEIPGIEGYKFAPEILESVRNLAVERNGEFGGLLDRVTSNIRTAMFTADLSAWTMQGWMLAMRDPKGAVKAMPHVLAASILGDRYTAEWIKDNYMLSRKWAARGVVNGHMVDEAAFGTKIGGMPVIHGIESRGFSNALPIFRILMAEHGARVEAMPTMVVESSKLGRMAGKLGAGNFVRLAQVGAAYGPLATGLAVAGADGELDPKDWQDWFALALGAGGTVAMSKVLGKVEKSAYDRLTPAQRAAVETRVAKDINRTSGIMNKPQLGISQKQAQIERTFLFRSPALLRNTLILAKLALTPGGGPEAQMARVYLLQTGLIMAGAAALTEYALTGKMDSFDPNDPNSILNPAHFAQAGLGAGGKASASNPLVSLARAVFYHNYAEGEPDRGLQVPQPRDVAQGLLQFGENRMTDVVGQAFKPGVDLIREGISGRPVENESPFASGLKSASEGDLRGVGAAVGRMGVPIPIQEAAASGAFKDIGIEGNPDYNTAKERIFSPLATMAGFNASPETLSQETKRRTDAAIREQFPAASDFNKNGVIDRRDLNDADRLAFDASPAGQEIAAFREEVRALRPDEEVTQVDRYFTAIDRELDLHVAKLRSLENAVANKSISKFEYRAAYQAEQARYIQAKDTVERDFSEQVMERPVYNPDTGKVENEMSVVAYVNRGVHPEDQNVDEWFKLYDSATGPNGKIDFDKLETMQETYKRSLAPDEAAYLEQRLASFKDKGVTDSEGNTVPLPALREYESVKEAAKPFWEIADQEFASLKERDPFFAQFANYNAYKKAILEAAQGDAIIAAAIEDGLKKRHPWLKRFSKSVERAQRTMRAQNVDLDIALTDWYERAPVNPLAYIARQAGDTQFDAMGQTFISGKRKVSQRQKLRLAQQYGLTSPDFGETFGYR